MPLRPEKRSDFPKNIVQLIRNTVLINKKIVKTAKLTKLVYFGETSLVTDHSKVQFGLNWKMFAFGKTLEQLFLNTKFYFCSVGLNGLCGFLNVTKCFFAFWMLLDQPLN